jgi:hypothetical protein
MRNALLLVLLLFAAALSAQEMWVEPYPLVEPFDSVEPYQILQCPDGGYAICGEVYDYEGQYGAGFILKIDSTGGYQWITGEDHSTGDYGFRAMVITDDGGFLAFNYSSGLTKFDSTGHFQWNIPPEQDGLMTDVQSMDRAADGNIIMAGSQYMGSLCALQKITQEGEVIWTRVYSEYFPLEYSWFYSVRALADGSFVAGGNGINTRGDDAILKADCNGDTLFTQHLPLTGGGALQSLAVSPNGYISFCGAYGISMLSPTGELLWYHYDETGYRSLYSVTALNNNTFTAFYLFIESLSNYYGGLVNYNVVDSVLWDTPLGVTVTPPSWTGDKIVINTSDGGYVMCGSMVIAKTDSLGRVDSTNVTTDAYEPPTRGLLLSLGPNPFRSSVDIRCGLADAQHPFLLQIFNLRGQLVRELSQTQASGTTSVLTWDAQDRQGKPVSSGVYLFRLTQGSRQAISKALYLK